MNYANLTETELLREAMDSTDPLVRALAEALDAKTSKPSELAEKEAKLVTWAVSCLSEHAGEDHHADVKDRLYKAQKMLKADMIEEIGAVIEILDDMDMMACNSMEAMKSGDAF